MREPAPYLDNDGQAERADLRRRVWSGLAWTGGTLVYSQISRLVFGVFLARLLTPHEYGIAGMALVFSALVLGISDAGLGAGLVQRRTISEDDRSTVFWTSLGIGIALAAAGVALAGQVAAFFGEPAVRGLFMAVSLGFFVTALGRTHAALLQRNMAFRAIAVRSVAATFLGGCVGVTLAALGFGPWALVGLHLTIAAVTTILLWASLPWRPRLVFSFASLRKLGTFGLNVFGTKIVEYLNGNADKVLVGRFLGSSALGAYTIAFNLVLVPFVGLMGGLLDTLFPALSRVQHDHERTARAWVRGSRSVTALTAPAMLGLIAIAPDLVVVVLGERWRPAIPIVQVLAVVALVHSVTTLSTTVLASVDRTATLLRFSVVETIVIFAGIAVGLRWGVVGVAAALAGTSVVTRSVLVWLTARTLNVSAGWFFRSFRGVAEAAIAMALAVWFARVGLIEAGVAPALQLPALVATGVAVYVPLCLWRVPEVLAELRAMRGDRAAVPSVR